MGILDDLTPPIKKRPCKIRTELEKLDQADRDVLEAALLDRVNWSAIGLSMALKNRGLNLLDTTITRHRDGLCSC